MPAIQNKSRWKSLLCSPDCLLALALTAFVILLHIYFLLHAGGFWRDEVNLIDLANTHSFSQMERDSFPILMPLLVSIWSAIVPAHNDFALRILGVLIGLGIPAALWLVAWRVRRSPPVLGLALLALNFTLILYGDSLRGYGLGSLTIMLTIAAACAFLKNPNWPRTIILAVSAVLSVQALYQNALFIAAICGGAWAVCRLEKNWAAAVKIFVVAVVSAASLLPYFAQIASLPNASVSLRSGFDPQLVHINLDNALGLPLEQYVWIWVAFGLITLACVLASFGVKWRTFPIENSPVTRRTVVGMALASAFGISCFTASSGTPWFFFLLIIAAVIYLDSGHWLKYFPLPAPPVNPTADRSINWAPNKTENQSIKPPDDPYPLFAGVTLFIAVAAFAGFLWYAALPTESWYFIPLMALAAACFEIGLPRTMHTRAAIFGLALMAALMAVPAVRGSLDRRFTNLDLIADQVVAQAAPDDFILVSPWYDGITFNRYYHGPAAWDTIPPLADHGSHRYDLVLDEMKTPGAMQPLYDKISATLRAGHRVWIIGQMDLPKPGPMPDALASPPLPSTGWADRPYDIAWQKQVAQFLANHCANYNMVYQTTNQSVNFSECLKLYAATGWHDSPENLK
ncbi:MAG TPA: hypothetical protein VGN23_15460 [Verrucomicrobiae bacterium]